jgi:predicted amidohydrolase YtcJ
VSPAAGPGSDAAGRLDCAGLWTGRGSPLTASTLRFAGGRILGIEPCTNRCPPPVFVIPSFVDAHCHLSWTGLQEVTLDLQHARSASGMLASISSRAASVPRDEILRAEKFDESTWDSPMLPGLPELNSAAGGRPAIIRRVCGHLVLVTSALMDRLPSGCPGLDRSSGTIREGAALEMDMLFPPSDAMLAGALDAAGRTALSLGLTAVQTMEPMFVVKALSSRPPAIRLSAGVFHRDAGMLAAIAGNDADLRGVRINGMKIFLDGALGAGTAAVDGCYPDGSSAGTIYEDESLRTALLEAAALGLIPMVHAIGAESLRMLDRVSFELARTDPASLRLGIRVEHAEELLPAWPGTWNPSIHRFSMQPNFVSRWQDPGGMYHRRLGAARADRLNPFGLVSRSGFMLGFGSDGMPFGPLKGISGATGHPVPEYRLDTREALHAYTLGAASISGFRELAEPVREGRIADLAVLTADPFRVPWEEIRLVATVMGGTVVYGPGDLICREEGA